MTTMQKTNPVKTVLTISVGFTVLYLMTKWDWTIITALAVGLAGVFSTYLSKKIDFIWMKLSLLLSLIVPNVLLTIIFFLLLFPIALLSRMFGNKDPLNLKNKNESYFKSTDRPIDKASFEKLW
jgi:ABC-type microcin C transport system permease subunit YejE